MSAQRDWAREHFRGAESLLMGSFLPDFTALDEDAIRHDVRSSIDHGFYGTVSSRAGITDDESIRAIEVALDEADGRILVSAMTSGASIEDDVAWAQRCAQLGCSHLFVMTPRAQPNDTDEIIARYRPVVEATDLPIILYASIDRRRAELGPTGVTLEVFDHLADIPNVVAIKVTQPMPASTVFRVAECLSDRLLLGPVNLELFPVLARHYGVQWTGQWLVEALQSPAHPYVVDFVDACVAGDFDAAMRTFDDFEPALRSFFAFQAPLIERGVHPRAHMKYFQWCTGGNGGLVRAVAGVPALDADGQAKIRDSYAAIGIDVDESDTSFLAGRAASARGARPEDVAPNSLWQGAVPDTLVAVDR